MSDACPNPEPCPVHPRRWPRLADTGVLQRSYPRGSAADLVAAVEQVRPAHIRLVGIIVQGRTAPWWWRWVEPVALWLLRRAGYEVCR